MYKIINNKNTSLYLLVMAVVFTLLTSKAEGDSLFGKKLIRVNKQGDITVSATYLEPKNSDQARVSFIIKIHSHSVDLYRYNFERISFVQFDDNDPVSDALWDFTGSSKFMSGILTFEQNIPRATRKIRLLIKKVGGIEERIFEWEFPPSKFSQQGGGNKREGEHSSNKLLDNFS